MRIIIQREQKQEYDVETKDATLLEILQHIKITQDPTLTFVSGCRSSVCGSCAVRVNSKEVLACAYKPKDGDLIKPLKNSPVIRDLVVDMDKAYSFNTKAKAWQNTLTPNKQLTQTDEKINEIQSDCILCGSCHSACPVYEVNKEFIGPFALTRVWRYVSDKREQEEDSKISIIQADGIWDCTLCNECAIVCPQNISSKMDIEKLRSKSAIKGYNDPGVSSFGFDGGLGF